MRVPAHETGRNGNAVSGSSMIRTLAYDCGKRTVDILLATVAGIATAPIVVLVAVMLWCMQGKVLFCQLRPGLHGKPFRLYKFCTMSEEKNDRGELLPDCQRITAIGRVVRSLSIDELPQLWNVIRGDMSLVGPRPLLMEYLTRYSSEQARRHQVKPGITGWAQVNGRNSLSWNEKFELDLWYVNCRSIFLDLRILMLTAWQVICRAGISNENSATMPEFLGAPSFDGAFSRGTGNKQEESGGTAGPMIDMKANASRADERG